MEMENNNVMLKEKLDFSGIIKEAVTIPPKNTKFIIFTFLTSLPFFCTMVFYELILQRTLIEASKILEPPYDDFYYTWPIPTYIQGRLSKEFSLNLILVGFLYLVPLHLLELFHVILTVDIASKIYAGAPPPMSLREMVHKAIKEARFKGPFITSLYALFLSTCTLSGLIWLVTNYYFISRNISYGYFFVIFYTAAFIALLAKYLEWTAVWNVSVVISVLEDLYGIPALVLSDYITRDSKQCGLVLMLVFFVWGFVLRYYCLSVGCYQRTSPVIAQVSLLCVGNVIKWVVCMVYFCDCKRFCKRHEMRK